jgi:hypothetical protein
MSNSSTKDWYILITIKLLLMSPLFIFIWPYAKSSVVAKMAYVVSILIGVVVTGILFNRPSFDKIINTHILDNYYIFIALHAIVGIFICWFNPESSHVVITWVMYVGIILDPFVDKILVRDLAAVEHITPADITMFREQYARAHIATIIHILYIVMFILTCNMILFIITKGLFDAPTLINWFSTQNVMILLSSIGICWGLTQLYYTYKPSNKMMLLFATNISGHYNTRWIMHLGLVFCGSLPVFIGVVGWYTPLLITLWFIRQQTYRLIAKKNYDKLTKEELLD